MTDPIIRTIKKVKGVLFADPELLYKEERYLVNQPFYFSGTNGKAVLLIHGWSSVPYEVRRLAMCLNAEGYTVSCPMMSGHGTVPKDLEDVKWNQWLADAEEAYQELKRRYGRVYVGGTSLGANLAVILGAKRPEIAGLVLMAMPYRIRFEKVVLFLSRILGKFKKYNRKFYPPTFGASTTITRVISYQTYPISSVLEAFELIRLSRQYVPRVTQPALMLQSSSDHIVPRNNLEMIYNSIGSKIKKKQYIKRAYHTFISDIKNEHVFEDILNFLNRN